MPIRANRRCEADDPLDAPSEAERAVRAMTRARRRLHAALGAFAACAVFGPAWIWMREYPTVEYVLIAGTATPPGTGGPWLDSTLPPPRHMLELPEGLRIEAYGPYPKDDASFDAGRCFVVGIRAADRTIWSDCARKPAPP